MRYRSAFVLILFLILAGCASTEKSTEEESDSPFFDSDEDISANYPDEDLSRTEVLLLRTRSHLSNHYSENQDMIPEQFLQEIVIEERQKDPSAGFRVQLLSTRSVAEADSVRDYFVAWADTTIEGYEPDAYVIFRSPHYRVRVGDFQDRKRAVNFSGMLKSKYPDAWVVHEQIEPSKVPADTTEIMFASDPDQ